MSIFTWLEKYPSDVAYENWAIENVRFWVYSPQDKVQWLRGCRSHHDSISQKPIRQATC